jgi:hypothetical protein
MGGGGGGTATLSAAAQFGIRDVLLGLRSLAKGLSDVPGRKMVIMLTQGFPLTDSIIRDEMTATIDACNKANVSVYPVDVRGLATEGPGMGPGPGRGIGHLFGAIFNGLAPAPTLASFSNSFQARGGGAPGGGGSAPGGGGAAPGGSRGGGAPSAPPSGGAGGRPSGGTTSPGGGNAGRGGGAAPVTPNRNINPMANPARIMPTFPHGIDTNQDALYALANGTGGFVIVNTNDLLGGMDKIAREQDQYYVIGFTPPESAEGSCHTLNVKVAKGDSVRSRTGFCNVRQVDLLAGKPAETELEALAVGVSAGKLGAPLQLPFFYASPNVARVNVAMEIPSNSFKFDKVKGKLHAEMNILGIAYRPDNSVAAKFSDTLKFDYENKVQVDEFNKQPVHYESQLDIASGQYTFKVVFSAGGENFGKIEKPLVIEPYDGKQFAMSALALGALRKADESGMDTVLIEDKVPLVAAGVQDVPAGQYAFHQSDTPGVYMELYEPGLTEEKPPQINIAIKITDRKTGEAKISSGNMGVDSFIRKGNPTVPVIMRLPVKDLPPGSYRLDVTGLDSAGKSMTRSAEFEVSAAATTGVGWDK